MSELNTNPYQDLPEKAFWKPSVSDKSMFDVSGLWDPKYRIGRKQKITTFGSCFAQHIGRALQQRGFAWEKTEVPPYGMSESDKAKFNYDIFSARTGNIYTASLLRQWVEWSLGKKNIPAEFWSKDGRVYDPFRPRVEPNGFASKEEAYNSRLKTVQSFRECIETSNFFVFTLGLTETWIHTRDGYEYPMCPGTVAGEFKEDLHQFVNQNFQQVQRSLMESIQMMREVNPKLRFILTVSPVPLTATNSGKHVVLATMQSKSTLRAVAGQLADSRGYVDYFPSYEMINSAVFKGAFFEPNQRSVNPYGVRFVMDNFFRCLEEKFGKYPELTSKNSGVKINTDIACEEELLSVFGELK